MGAWNFWIDGTKIHMRHDVVAELPDRNRCSNTGEKACFFALPVVAGHRLLPFAPLLAAVAFGSWAAFVNSEYGMFVLVRSGLGQGAYALCSTWIVTRVATNVFAFTGRTTQGMILSFVSSFLVMVSIPLTIHLLIGTPEITNAILPGLLWGSAYLAVYIWLLSKTGRWLQKPTGRHAI